MSRRRPRKDWPLPKAVTGRQWRRSYSARNLLLIVALVAAGVVLLTWGLMSAKGGM